MSTAPSVPGDAGSTGMGVSFRAIMASEEPAERAHGWPMTHLEALEAESMHIFREIVASSTAPCCCSPAARTRS